MMYKYVKNKRQKDGSLEEVVFKSQDELFEYLRKNKTLLELEKKSGAKHADGVPCFYLEKTEHPEKMVTSKTFKNDYIVEETGKLNLVTAINTTNIIDSHVDLHLPKIWNKSVKEPKLRYLLQEHKMQFEKIIAYPDDVKASIVTMSWKELGYNYKGDAEVLVYDVKADPADNEFMCDKYRKNKVKNHSVGMLYVKISLCMNSEHIEDKQEKENWDKYLPMAVNPEQAEKYGYFWAVLEAKEIEGSAVPLGSCPATPTIEVSESKSSEAVVDTSENEPLQDTQEKLTSEDVYRELKKVFNN